MKFYSTDFLIKTFGGNIILFITYFDECRWAV